MTPYHPSTILLVVMLLLTICGSSWLDLVTPFDLVTDPNVSRTLILEDGGLIMELHDFATQC